MKNLVKLKTSLSLIIPLLVAKSLKEDSSLKQRIDKYLSRLMGRERGIWQKLGQMLSTSSNKWEELSSLSTSRGPQQMSASDFHHYIQQLFREEELDFSLIESIEDLGKTASLSQVHQLSLIKDQGPKRYSKAQWIIKAKLPNIEQVINEQMDIFKLAELGQKLASEKKKFSSEDYFYTISDSFESELNYNKERDNILKLAELAMWDKTALIPTLHQTLQGRDFIIMEEAKGETWEEVLRSWSIKEKRRLGHTLLNQYLYQYFILGCAQGDFHPGNFLFTKTHQEVSISWLDLGQCLRPSKQKRKALLMAIGGQRGENLGDIFHAWDFNLEKLTPLKDRLPLILKYIFSPLVNMQATDLKKWNLQEKLDQIMGDDKWFFRTSGSPELFLSIRCWMGLIGMLEKLNTPLHFGQVWKERECEIEESLTDFSLIKTHFPKISFKDMAQKLVVRITEDDQLLVDISLPAQSIEELPQFISSDVLAEIENHSIDLNKTLLDVISSGLKPQGIIDLKAKGKHYLVYLEP